MNADRLLNYATVLVVVIALGVGTNALWKTTVQPRLDLRPVAIDDTEWAELLASGHRVGALTAPVQVVEFIDYQCEACRIFERRLEDFRASFPHSIAVTYLHWPLPRHAAAFPAARAIECAAEQDRFDEAHRYLIANTDWIADPINTFSEIVDELGILAGDVFQQCVRSSDPMPEIDKQAEWARELGGRGTPTVIINGRLLRTMPDSAMLHGFLRDAGGPQLPDQPTSLNGGAGSGTSVEPGPVPATVPTWTLSPEPTLSVGRVEGPPEELFHFIRGAAIMSSGRLAVVDAGAHVVRLYGPDGEYITSTGREGDGPGDFRAPALLEAVQYDSLVIASFGSSRISIVSSDGEARVAGRYSPSAWPRAALPNGVAVQELPTMGRRLARSGPRPGQDPVRILDPSRAEHITLGTFAYDLNFVQVLDSGRQRTLPIPFTAGILLAPTQEGVALNVGGGPEIIRYDLAGMVRDTIRLPLAPVAATDRHLERWIEDRLATVSGSSEREWRNVLGVMDIPDTLPVIERLLPDGAGGLWLELHTELQEFPGAEWIALDPSGEVVAGISFPDRFELRQVGRDFVLGIETGEFGVQRVLRYDLFRSD